MFLAPVPSTYFSRSSFERKLRSEPRRTVLVCKEDGVVMAFSAQNDGSQSSTREDDTSSHGESNESPEEPGKVFVPNPEAKPFFPGLQLDLCLDDCLTWGSDTTSHDVLQSQEMNQSPKTKHVILGQIQNLSQQSETEGTSCSLFHSSPSSEKGTPQLLIPISGDKTGESDLCNGSANDVCHGKSCKEHIAYHLLATVLGDEITEDTRHADLIDYGKETICDVLEGNDSWPASVSSISSSLSLTLDLGDHGIQQHSSFSNRSIHDIWSPNISPKESSQSSPSEEAYSFFPSDSGHDSPFHCNSREFIEAGLGKGLQLSSPTSVPLNSGESLLLHIRSPTDPRFGQGYSSSFPSTNNNYISSSPDSLFEKLSHPLTENGFCAASFSSQLSYFSEDHNSKTASDYEDLPDSFMSFDDSESFVKAKRHSVHFEEKSNALNGGRREEEYPETKSGKDESASAAKLLGLTLDECLDQLRSLEKECRKAEHQLSKIYPSRRGSSSCGTNHVSKLPANPTRVDKMILEQSKEHGKVESLVGRIERLGSSPLHPNVGVALDRWLACIKELQTIRKEEINTSSGPPNGHYPKKSYSEKDLYNLAKCMKDLIAHTRAARTTVWCAVQMLHADSVEHANNEEEHSDMLSVRS